MAFVGNVPCAMFGHVGSNASGNMPLRRSRSPVRVRRRYRRGRVASPVAADSDDDDDVTVTLSSVREIQRVVLERLATFRVEEPDVVVAHFTVVGIIASTFSDFRATALGEPSGPFGVVDSGR